MDGWIDGRIGGQMDGWMRATKEVAHRGNTRRPICRDSAGAAPATHLSGGNRMASAFPLSGVNQGTDYCATGPHRRVNGLAARREEPAQGVGGANHSPAPLP